MLSGFTAIAFLVSRGSALCLSISYYFSTYLMKTSFTVPAFVLSITRRPTKCEVAALPHRVICCPIVPAVDHCLIVSQLLFTFRSMLVYCKEAGLFSPLRVFFYLTLLTAVALPISRYRILFVQQSTVWVCEQ